MICESCADRVGYQLVELGYVYDDLEAVLAASSGGAARFDKVDGSRTPPLPVRIDVADHRDTIRALLVSWTMLVVEERELDQVPANDVHALSEFLTGNVSWLACHPAGGDLCHEIGGALGRGRGLRDAGGVVKYLPCPDPHDEGCAGRIRVTLESTWVRCDTCGWEIDDLLRLGKLLRAGEPARVTIADACHRLLAEGRPTNPRTVQKWAERGKLQPQGRNKAGRLLYDYDQIHALATTRHRASA